MTRQAEGGVLVLNEHCFLMSQYRLASLVLRYDGADAPHFLDRLPDSHQLHQVGCPAATRAELTPVTAQKEVKGTLALWKSV